MKNWIKFNMKNYTEYKNNYIKKFNALLYMEEANTY